MFSLFYFTIKSNAIYFKGFYIFYDDFDWFGPFNSIFENRLSDISTKQSIEILIITIIAIFMLKHKYFIHHYLSIALFCLSTIAYDLILNNYYVYFDNSYWLKILSLFIGFFTEGIYFCYIKYMIDIHYHYYWNIIFSIGIMIIINNSFTLITYIIIGNKPFIPSFVRFFWEYFDNVPTKIIASKFIINVVFQFIYNVLEILTIFYLSPEYIIISQNLSNIFEIIYLLTSPDVFFNSDFNSNYIYCGLIFFVVQIFSLLIHFEILELNFCNLNKNTRKNIKLRMNDELSERNDSHHSIDFDGGYLFDNQDSNENNDLNVELYEIKYQYNSINI